MPLRRPSTSGDGHSVASSSPSFSLGTKRRFPLLGRKKTRNSELPRPSSVVLPSTSSSHKISKPGLRVHVQVKFENPVGSEHVRDYEASPQLKASDRLCQALLSRLQHCSAELITRHDCTALDPLRKPHRDVKPLRYRITYRVERDGLVLVEKSLRSFQEYELTHDDAREVIAATDRIIGLFLVRHDPAFRWSESADAESASPEAETVRPCTGRPQSTACIPRSRFVHETQSFELVSGYSIELFLRSRCATRYPENRNASIKIDSRQPTPLTLVLGEELTTRVSNLIIDPVDALKRKFDKKHKSCNGFEGSGGCTHIEDGAVDIMVKVRNNLGPDYTYFSHRIQTSKVLFNDHQGRDFDEFANQVKAKLEKARDMTDKSMRSLDDLTLHIRELRGNGWSVHEPLLVRLDPSVTYCRQTIEAVMERLQAGISNVLEHHEDALATMTVHKRGHLIYDGFLDGAGGDDSTPLEKFASPELERKALEARLKERIRADITMLCKDTCAIDCPDTLPNLRLKASGAAASSIGAASSIAPPPSIGASSSVAPTPSLTASATISLNRPSSQLSISESLGSSRSEHTLSKKTAQPNLKDPAQPASPRAPPSPDLRRVPSGVELARKNGYMADFIADDENQSEPPSTPSLVDTDSISPQDSVVVTPQSSRAVPQDQSNEGLRIVDDGRRIIYQEQSDIDAIASGVVQFHRPINDDDEPIQLTKERPAETPDRRAARRSLDTRMPNLSGNMDSVMMQPNKGKAVDPEKEQKPKRPTLAEPAEIKAATGVFPSEGVLEYSCKPVSPVAKEPMHEEPVPKQTNAPAEPPKIPESEAEVDAPTTLSDEAPILSTSEKPVTPQALHDEQWEMVEASEAARELPKEIEANTKSETSFGTTPAASVRGDADATEIPAPAPVAVAADAQLKPSEHAEKEVDEAESQTPKVSPVTPEQAEAVLDVDVAEKRQADNILNDFPKPPSVHSQADEVNHSNEKHQEEVSQTKEHSEPTIDTAEVLIEAPKTETVEVPVQDLEKPSVITSEGEEAPQSEPVRASSDSGISMEEQVKEQDTQRPIVTESAETTSEPETPEVDVPRPIGRPAEEQADAAIPETSDSSPTVATEKIATLLETVPEEERPAIPRVVSAPLEAFPPQEDFLNLPSVLEKKQDPAAALFDAPNFPPILPRTRPRTSTLPSRRYSTALTLEIDVDALKREDDDSPIGDPPKSAIGVFRKDSLHRRQPSAGFVGLHEPRLHKIGLRNALVPYRWQALRREQAVWEGRPGTSHSEQ
ncbi:hypothetical protein ACJ41O_002465 [Fusarium nematophilum]